MHTKLQVQKKEVLQIVKSLHAYKVAGSEGASAYKVTESKGVNA